MRAHAGTFQLQKRGELELPVMQTRHFRKPPAMRTMLAEIEREFSDLMSRNARPLCAEQVAHRINLAQRLLGNAP